MQPAPPHVDVPCAHCGARAARFEALRAGEGEGLLRDRDRLVRTGYPCQSLAPQPYEQALSTLAALTRGALTELFEGDRDLYGFYCRACEKAYCATCWRTEPPRFDEGFYDCTYATCPAGHSQMVDD